jgi:hypothetical protein
VGYIACVIDTNYGKTTRIPNIPETGTLLKHGTEQNENFGNKKKKIFKTAIKSFESCGYFWVGRLTANNQYFNLGLTVMYIQGKFWYFSYSVF